MGVMTARAYSNGGGVQYSRDHSWHGLLHTVEALVRGRSSTRIGNQAAKSQHVGRHPGPEALDRKCWRVLRTWYHNSLGCASDHTDIGRAYRHQLANKRSGLLDLAP